VKVANRMELLTQLEELMNVYCKDCLLHDHFKKEGGRRRAHRFCISQCTVGEKLKEYGKMLK
jgi:transcriptional regulator of aromatic amino acid metabolism